MQLRSAVNLILASSESIPRARPKSAILTCRCQKPRRQVVSILSYATKATSLHTEPLSCFNSPSMDSMLSDVLRYGCIDSGHAEEYSGWIVQDYGALHC